MTATFDSAVQELVRMCVLENDFGRVKRACVIRDLRGRLRLAVQPDSPTSLGFGALEAKLRDALGGYFVPPILRSDGPPEHARLAFALFEQACEWPETWPCEVRHPVTGVATQLDDRWVSVQRVLSKDMWVSSSRSRPPWPLHARTPAVTAFYSFKGGVGRSTLAAAMAWHLAREEGKKVVVLDLDLEAPGVGQLLGANPEQGVLDWIVDRCAGAEPDLTRCHAAASALGADGARVSVFPSGKLSWPYLEKLARLDFVSNASSGGSDSPVEEALRGLLKAVKKEMSPDHILIDSRSGLHDLGGLSIHGLAHVDVLVSRTDPQSLAGLGVTLEALRRRRSAEEDLAPLVVQAMARAQRDEAASSQRERFREQVYELFLNHVYRGQDVADAADTDAPHFPWVVPRYDGLDGIGSFAEAPEASVFDDPFVRLRGRLVELAGAEEIDEEESA